MIKLIVTGVIAMVFATACGGGSPPPTEAPTVVSALSLAAISDELKAGGIVVSAPEPGVSPRLALTEAVAEIETAGVRPTTGTLIIAEQRAEQGNWSSLINPPRLIWAVRVDPSASTVPDLFPPDASLTFAFIDANDGTLQGVFTR